ncbi:MAG: glutamine-hydrolyzing carbamoyl-phosphate synthase small subunit, partial [Deltaproteobacteria bacterium]|nr:glutamine-hydrolyzing carbamoyl-phosphate synthase small subunit [Deltaproteobacteria bacterium]
GYQEVLTDPSYAGQIVAMTYPHIGNYGINHEDVESERIRVAGFIAREYHQVPSNWRSERTLADYLSSAKILGLTGIDTRALTLNIRTKGAMRGIISTEDFDLDSLIEKAQASPSMVGLDLVKEVTCREPFVWPSDTHEGRLETGPEAIEKWTGTRTGFKVAALDYGIKYNILRSLTKAGARVLVLPANTLPDDILAYGPDGIFLSNGPGDPLAVTYAHDTIRALLGEKPIFGICLGHQFLGLALGGERFKLKFGHRGANQPVKDLITGKIEITSQNHGFCVDLESLEGKGVKLTHINLNDNTLEGLEDRDRRFFSVQYHPEACPGPHDAAYLFDRFMEWMKD